MEKIYSPISFQIFTTFNNLHPKQKPTRDLGKCERKNNNNNNNNPRKVKIHSRLLCNPPKGRFRVTCSEQYVGRVPKKRQTFTKGTYGEKVLSPTEVGEGWNVCILISELHLVLVTSYDVAEDDQVDLSPRKIEREELASEVIPTEILMNWQMGFLLEGCKNGFVWQSWVVWKKLVAWKPSQWMDF